MKVSPPKHRVLILNILLDQKNSKREGKNEDGDFSVFTWNTEMYGCISLHSVLFLQLLAHMEYVWKDRRSQATEPLV